MKRILLLSFAVLILSITTLIPCAAYDYDYYSNEDYVFSNYDVTIDIGKDNILDITEVITADFSTPRHGIFRSIPMYNKIQRDDGSLSKNNVQITDLSCSDEYSTYFEDDSLIMKIGSPDYTVEGKHTYTIKYKYNLGRDTMKNGDEFYFNIIGTKFEAPIMHVDFELNFPDDFDSDKLGFSTGAAGMYGYDEDDLKWSRSGNTITGYLIKPLNAYEGLTVRLELPEGYFSEAKIIFDKSSLIGFIGIIICTAGCIFLYFYSSKKNFYLPTVEFYPPDGMNSTELAMVRNEKVTREDVVSLLPYLAQKGYIQIEKSDEQMRGKFAVIKSSDHIFTKKRPYNGNDTAEKIFMDGLFRKGEKVFQYSLYNKFYKTSDKIVSYYKKSSTKAPYFKKTVFTIKQIYVILSLLVTLLGFIVPFLFQESLTYINNAIMFILPIFFGAAFLVIISSSLIKKNILSTNSSSRAAGIILFAVVGAPFLLMLIYFLFQVNLLLSQKILLLFTIIDIIFLVVLYPKINNLKTEYGLETIGKIKGFENFIKTAEKGRLKMLAEENPSYFYDIIPYAYVMGISDVWIKNFKGIVIDKPDWYTISEPYTWDLFDRMMDSCSNSMTYVPQSSNTSDYGSSGGGFSGGGFSGGGSGGGGGGAW